MKYKTIIVGAGAAGLMASYELTKAGIPVLLLEARDRTGGRIHTIHNHGFSKAVEAGAEFIHGDLSLTSSLLQSAKIPYAAMDGKMYQLEKGELQQKDFLNEELELLLKALHELRSDMSFAEFLHQKFPGSKYASLRRRSKQFVEGYNAADMQKASAIALRDEWSAEEDPVQYRPQGGYGALMRFLLNECVKLGLQLHLSKRVTNIQWQRGVVTVQTQEGDLYEAEKVVLTVPLGVLQSKSISITPEVPDYIAACKSIGYGPVIKFLFEFHQPFWQKDCRRKMPSLKFIFSDAVIPTWWSQLPDITPILTGWLGGPAAERKTEHPEHLFRQATDSLAYIFGCSEGFLKAQLKAFHIAAWNNNDPFALGAYSYTTIATTSAKKLLNQPVDDTLYFGGEALYDGPHTGTVEAALTSGKEVAHRIIHKTVNA